MILGKPKREKLLRIETKTVNLHFYFALTVKFPATCLSASLILVCVVVVHRTYANVVAVSDSPNRCNTNQIHEVFRFTVRI